MTTPQATGGVGCGPGGTGSSSWAQIEGEDFGETAAKQPQRTETIQDFRQTKKHEIWIVSAGTNERWAAESERKRSL